MKRKNGFAVLAGVSLFALLIGTAIFLESAYVLYAASAVPILLVPFLPDFSGSQKLKSGQPSDPVRIYLTSGQAEEGFLIIDADPGAIQWNKRRLYVPVDGIPVRPAGVPPRKAASIPVLQYDLIRHPRKKDLIGIRLNHLADRIQSLPYTTDEVTRLVVRIEDLKRHRASVPAGISTASRKGLEA